MFWRCAILISEGDVCSWLYGDWVFSERIAVVAVTVLSEVLLSDQVGNG
jgi:hypothetical protein